MFFKIHLFNKLGFMPPVLAYLASIPESSYSYNYYSLRHPGGIFNLQLNSVSQNFLGFFAHFKKMNESGYEERKDGPMKDELIRNYTLLLLSFNNYLDSVYEIILGLCKQHSVPGENEPLYNWFKKYDYTSGDKFYSGTKDKTLFLKEIFNKLKHKSNTLRYITSVNLDNNEKILGYYLESASSDGVIGPNEALHPKFNGKYSANSFNFDLRKLYFCLYIISDALLVALLHHFREVYSQELIPNTEWSQDDSNLKNLYKEIINLPNLFFENEFGKTLTYPKIETKSKEHYLIFEEKKIEPNKGRFKIEMVTKGDGFSRSFRLPLH